MPFMLPGNCVSPEASVKQGLLTGTCEQQDYGVYVRT